MIQTEIRNGRIFISATEGKLRKKGAEDTIGKRTYLLPGEAIDIYEEVTQELPYTKAELNAKITELIHRRYSQDAEIALINNMQVDSPIKEHIDEYKAYQAYRAECKAKAPIEVLKDKEQERLMHEQQEYVL